MPPVRDVLPDLLGPSLRLVICGSAAGTVSARRGAYYAGPGNAFYRTLYEIGLTDRLLRPEEYAELITLGIGLTDVGKRAFGPDAAIPADVWDAEAVRAKVLRCAPRVLAFNGKNAARRTLGRDVPYGRLPDRLGQTLLFVCPSTSGRARRFMDPQVWRDLARLLHSLDSGDGNP